MPRGIKSVAYFGGRPVQWCCVCGRMIYIDQEVVCVSGETRKNPHAGRIAWERDGICMACAGKERETE